MKLLFSILLFFSPLLPAEDKAASEQDLESMIEERSFNEDEKSPPENRPVHYYFDYTVLKDDTFALIIKKFVKPTSIISAKTPMILKTRDKNPHIKDWANLKKGEVFRLYVSSNFLNKVAVKKYFKDKKPKSWNFPLFYMASLGTFTQEFDNGTVLNFHQNSPISLGTAYTYYPKQKNYSLSTSMYLSVLKSAAAEVDGNDSTVSVPMEIGGNVYYDYKMVGKNYNLYGGIDFERFSTFNKNELLEDGVLVLDKNFVTYLTVGWSKLFKVWKFPVFTKISVSRTLTSSQSAEGDALLTGTPYSGWKYMLYFNYRVKGPWFAHFLYKVHMMEGPDKLSTNRAGIGFGYNFK